MILERYSLQKKSRWAPFCIETLERIDLEKGVVGVAKPVSRLFVWGKGEKIAEGTPFLFPLHEIFSPIPQTESLFTG